MSTLLSKYGTSEEQNLGKVTIAANIAGTQAGATTFAVKHVNIGTCAGAGYSVAPSFAALAGAEFWIVNNGANSANLFPKNGGTDKFESQAANSAFAVASGECWHVKCIVDGTWRIK